jgi:hypothetical protein
LLKQHLRALPTEELAPLVGAALVDAGICKDASGAFATGATGLCKGSMELVADVVPQIQQLLQYPVSGFFFASLAAAASVLYMCLYEPLPRARSIV